jgi:hypothetical protein
MLSRRIIVAAACAFAITMNAADLPLAPFSKWQRSGYREANIKGKDFVGITKFEKGKTTAFLHSPKLDISTNLWNVFQFKMKCSKSGTGRLFYKFKGGKYNDKDRIDFRVKPAQKWQVYRLQLPSDNRPVEQFRLAVIHTDNARVELSSPGVSNHASVPQVDSWTPYNYKNVKLKKNYFRGTTVFVKRKKTPCLYSPEVKINIKEPSVFSFKLNTNQNSTGRLFFRLAGKKFNDVDRIDFRVITGKDYKTYYLYLPTHNAPVVQFRFDLFTEGTDIHLTDLKVMPVTAVDKINLPVASSSSLTKVPDISVIPETDGIMRFGVKPASSGVKLNSNRKNWIKLVRCSLNFQSPTNLYQISLTKSGRAAGALKFRIKPFDIFGKCLPVVKFTIPLAEQVKPQHTFTLPIRTASFLVEVTPEIRSGGELEVLNAKICPVIRKADLWQGKWIWHAEKWHPHKAFFRKTFNLKSLPLQARFLLTMDDDINAIYLNNKKIPLPLNANNVRLIDIIDVTEYLRKGKNVLAIAGSDRGGYKGLICELAVYGKNNYELFKSDSSFKAAGRAFAGWEKMEFDDSKWSFAIKAPHSMSRDLPHIYMGDKKTLEIFKVYSAEFSNGRLNISLGIKSEKHNVALDCSLKADGNVYYLGSYLAEALKTGVINRVNFSLSVGEFVPAGKYSLVLDSQEYLLPRKQSITVEIPSRTLKKDLPKVKIHYGDNFRTPLLNIDGQIHSFTHLFTTDNHRNQIKNLEQNQVWQYWLSELQPIWKGPGKYDFSPVDRKITELLQFSPNSYVLAQIPVDTFLLRSMKRWVKMYPDEVVLDAAGNHLIEVHGRKMAVPSWGSEIWRKEISTLLSELVKHVRKQPYASRVIAFMPIAGLGAEWMYYGAHNHLYVDYSKPFARAFRRWLKQRYGSIDKLNKTWGSEYKDFEQILVPTPKERDYDDKFTFLDPAKRCNIIDLRTFFSELTSDVIRDLGKVIKKASDGRSLCGTYYGYITYTALNTWSENGHFALNKLLNSDSVDFLVSLVRYDNRYVGGESGSMTPVNSFILHNKAAVIQSDLRTHRSVARNYMATSDLMDSAAVLKRELAWALVTGAVFEFGYYGKGWIASDLRLMELIGRYQHLEKKYADNRQVFSETSGQIALIVDDSSVNYVIQKSPYFRLGNRELIRQLAHAGTGFDIYMLSDLPRIADKYRCFIFSNTYLMSAEQVDFIKKHLRKQGRTLVWMHTPGITDGNTWSPARVSELTGMKLNIQRRAIAPDSKVAALSKYLSPGTAAFVKRRVKGKLGPRLIPLNGEVLACGVDGQPVIVRKKFKDSTCVYSWIPNMTPSILQEIADKAGLTVINPATDDSTYAAGRLVAIHTNQGGSRILNIPDSKAKKLIELFSQKEYLIKDGVCKLRLNPKSTYLFVFE